VIASVCLSVWQERLGRCDVYSCALLSSPYHFILDLFFLLLFPFHSILSSYTFLLSVSICLCLCLYLEREVIAGIISYPGIVP